VPQIIDQYVDVQVPQPVHVEVPVDVPVEQIIERRVERIVQVPKYVDVPVEVPVEQIEHVRREVPVPVPRAVPVYMESVREVPVQQMPSMPMMPPMPPLGHGLDHFGINPLMTPAATLPGTLGAASHVGMETGLLHNVEGLLNQPLLPHVAGHQFGFAGAPPMPPPAFGLSSSYGAPVTYGTSYAAATSQAPGQ